MQKENATMVVWCTALGQLFEHLAVWLSGNALALIDVVALRQISMGDRLWTGKPSWYVTSQLGRLSLLPSVGR